MDILNRLVQVIGAVMTIRGLFGVFTGAQDFFSGRKNDNPNKMDNGIESMVTGGAMAAISATIATAIIAALSQIRM